jgi:hypothetical protein
MNLRILEHFSGKYIRANCVYTCVFGRNKFKSLLDGKNNVNPRESLQAIAKSLPITDIEQ